MRVLGHSQKEKNLRVLGHSQTVSFTEELCIGCSEGCTECIQACPFYKKGYDAVFEKYENIKRKSEKIAEK